MLSSLYKEGMRQACCHMPCNPSTQEEAEADDLWVQGQYGLHSEFLAIQGYTEDPVLEHQRAW